MSEEKMFSSDEINFKRLLLALWDGKWLVLSVVAVAVAVSCLYLYSQSNRFSGFIQIKPIRVHEETKYTSVGANTFFPINAKILLGRYLETLQDHSFLRESADNVYAAKKSQFTSLDAYNDFLDGIANSFKLHLPLKEAESDVTVEAFLSQGILVKYPELQFQGDDQKLYTRVLPHALSTAHARVKEDLTQEFNAKVKIKKIQSFYAIKGLEAKLKNALSDYEKTTSSRIEYLREQRSIARKLGIAQDTLEAQTFHLSEDTSSVTTILGGQRPRPFFLRGYEAIEEELRLLEARTNKAAFVPELLGLNQSIRSIKQDSVVEQAKLLLESTPIGADNGDFEAATIVVSELQIRYKNRPRVVIGVFVFLGFIAGLLVLGVRNTVRE